MGFLERLGLAEWISLACFSLTVALGVWRHESWADESQAWLMARDMKLWDLLAHGVRYEGTPPLWHLFLKILVDSHLSFAAMHWVSGAVAVAGTMIWLAYSRLPRGLKLLVPFTFFLAYQNAVVARSYVLAPSLTFAAVAILSQRKTRPVALAITLGLLANTSSHGMVESAGLAAAAAWTWKTELLPWKRNYGLAATLLVAFWGIAVLSARPPADVDFPAGVNMQKSWNKLLGLKEAAQTTHADASNELHPIPPTVVAKTTQEARETNILRLLGEITFPISESRWLALSIFALVLLRLFDRPSFQKSQVNFGWLGVVPYLLMVLVFWRLYIAPRHMGVLAVSFFAALWMSWPTSQQSGWKRLREFALVLLLTAVCLEQSYWTAKAVFRDWKEPYSGDLATANFLKRHLGDKKVAGFYFHTVGPLAYFGHNIYFNQPAHGYWLWSNTIKTEADAPKVLAAHPDYIVVGGFNWGPEGLFKDWKLPDGKVVQEGQEFSLADNYALIPYFEKHGYQETHLFCGHGWMRLGYAEELCQAILEPKQILASGNSSSINNLGNFAGPGGNH